MALWRRYLGSVVSKSSLGLYRGVHDEASKVSRNEKKRVAHYAVRVGMQLAKFSTPQIKRILKLASLDRELLDALLIAKTLDREAKRRQFNFVGKLLRDVDPQLMNSLILATLEGDKNNFDKLFGFGSWDIVEEDEDEDDPEDTQSEDDAQQFSQGSGYRSDILERWYNGLIIKDISITNEVYSLDVEFDRQELRRLVRRVQSVQGNQISSEEKVEEAEAKHLRAKKSLTRFLRNIVKQMPEEE